MRRPKRRAKRAWLKNTDILLLAASALSFLLFFACLIAVPKDAIADNRALLVGAGAMLALCLPAAFCLRAVGGDSLSYLGRMPKGASLWRTPMFAIGAFALGVFADRFCALPFMKGDVLLARLPDSGGNAFVLAIAYLILSFATVLLPFGLLSEHLFRQGIWEAVLPSAFLYAAFLFSFCASPIFLFFGLLLSLLRLQSSSFLSAFLCNAALMAGIFASNVGAFSFFTKVGMPSVAVFLVLGAIALGLLVGAIDFRFWSLRLRGARISLKGFLPWMAIDGTAFLLSLPLSALLS